MIKRTNFSLVASVMGLVLAAGMSGGGGVPEVVARSVDGVGAGVMAPVVPVADWVPGNATWFDGNGNSAGQPVAATMPGGWEVGADGVFRFSSPLDVPDGRRGMTPSLTLSYASGGGNGPLGMGWAVTGATSVIARCGRSFALDGFMGGVNHVEAGEESPQSELPDRLCLDGQRLVGVSGTYGGEAEYRTEQESFTQILSYRAASTGGADRFVVKDKSGMISTYLPVEGKRYAAMASGMSFTQERLMWVRSTVEDRFGNMVKYTHEVWPHPAAGPDKADGMEFAPISIEYTWSTKPGVPADIATAYRKVQFIYQQRPDEESAWSLGTKWVKTRRLNAIIMFAPKVYGATTQTAAAWKYEFEYRPKVSASSERTLLASVRRCATDGIGKAIEETCTWKKRFDWQATAAAPTFSVQKQPFELSTAEQRDYAAHHPAHPLNVPAALVLDANGDGSDDLFIQRGLVEPPSWEVGTLGTVLKLGQTYSDGTVAPLAVEYGGSENGVPTGLFAQTPKVVQLPGRTDSFLFYDNSKVRLERTSPVDFDGNGQVELLTTLSTRGGVYPEYIYTCQEKMLEWQGTSGFQWLSTPSFSGYECGRGDRVAAKQFADWDGDGRTDLLRAEWEEQEYPYGEDQMRIVPGKWKVYQNTGTTFTWKSDTQMRSGCPTQVVDTDGDGLDELVALEPLLDTPNKNPLIRCAGSTVQHIEKREGASVMTAVLRKPQLVQSPWPVAYAPEMTNYTTVLRKEVLWGDVTGDGNADALLWNRDLGSVWLRINTGNGFLPPVGVNGLILRELDSVRFWDANRDGKIDVLVLSAPDPVDLENPANTSAKLYVSKGDGTFVQTAIPGGLDKGVWVDEDGDFNLNDALEACYATVYSYDDSDPFHLHATPKIEQIACDQPDAVTRWDLANDPGFNLTKLGDFNRDGKTDYVTVKRVGESQHELWLYTQTSEMNDRIVAVYDAATDPAIKITYSTQWADRPEPQPLAVCGYPVQCQYNGGTPVVREVSVRVAEMGTAKWQTFRYSYAKLRRDVQEGALGFQYFWVWDPLRNVETTYEFAGTPYSHPDKPGRRFWPREAQQVTTAVPIYTAAQLAQASLPTVVAGRVTRSQVTTYEVRLYNSDKTWALLPRESTAREWEQSISIDPSLTSPSNAGRNRIYNVKEPATVLRRMDQVVDYDADGNASYIEAKRQGGANTIVETVYVNDHVRWLLGLPSVETVTVKEADPSIPQRQRQTKYYYSYPEGVVSWVEREPDEADPTLKLRTVYARNDYGLVTRIDTQGLNSQNQPETRTVHVARDPVFPGQPREEIYASQSWSSDVLAGGKQLSSWTAVDPAYGVPVVSMDALGNRTFMHYDKLGRPTLIENSVTSSKQRVRYAPRSDASGGVSGVMATTETEDSQGQVTTAMAEVDGWGRTILTTTQGFDGGWIKVRQGYDKYGRLSSVSRPYPGGSPFAFTTWEYDSLGRPTAVRSPDGKISTMSYAQTPTMATVLRQDPSGNTAKTVYDVNGRLTESIQYLQQDNKTLPLSTQYTYWAGGLLRSTAVERRANPNDINSPKTFYTVSNFAYDKLGRLSSSLLAGEGLVSFYYDSFGALKTALQAGEKSVFTYDKLGRPTARTNVDANGITQFQTQLEYDTATFGLGQLAKATAINGTAPGEVVITTPYYDASGRTRRVDTWVDDRTYTNQVSFDADGRLASLSYPALGSDPTQASLTLCYGYNARHALEHIGYATAGGTCNSQESAAGDTSLWQVQQRNADGSLLRGLYGNGMMATRVYDNITGRLESLSTYPTAQSAAPWFRRQYQYTEIGQIRQITDPLTQVTEISQYDSLGRQTRWDRTVDGQTRRMKYTYDDLGNLTDTLLNVTPQGQPEGTFNLLRHNEYTKPGNPFAVSLSTDYGKIGGAETQVHEYDQRGRLISSTRQGDQQYTRLLEYVQGGLLPRKQTNPQVGGGTWFTTYDAAGQRVKETGPDGTIYYVGGLERRLRPGEKTQSVVRLSGTDGMSAEAVFEDINPTPKLRYLLTDHLGSSSAVVEQDQGKWGISDYRYNEPFGLRINRDGSPYAFSLNDPLSRLTQGFTGHREEYKGPNNTQTHMNGRIYDPTLGRFMTPDPLRGIAGQAASPYTYVGNSPLNFTDPSGYQANLIGNCDSVSIDGTVYCGLSQVLSPLPPEDGPPPPSGRGATRADFDDYYPGAAMTDGYHSLNNPPVDVARNQPEEGDSHAIAQMERERFGVTGVTTVTRFFADIVTGFLGGGGANAPMSEYEREKYGVKSETEVQQLINSVKAASRIGKIARRVKALLTIADGGLGPMGMGMNGENGDFGGLLQVDAVSIDTSGIVGGDLKEGVQTQMLKYGGNVVANTTSDWSNEALNLHKTLQLLHQRGDAGIIVLGAHGDILQSTLTEISDQKLLAMAKLAAQSLNDTGQPLRGIILLACGLGASDVQFMLAKEMGVNVVAPADIAYGPNDSDGDLNAFVFSGGAVWTTPSGFMDFDKSEPVPRFFGSDIWDWNPK